MAKSKGSAGRIPRGSRSYSDWIAGPYNEAIGWGAWVMTPDGKMLENAKIVSNPGASVMDFSYHEDAFQAIGERDGWGKATNLYTEAERRGFTRIRLWDMGGGRRTISISMDRNPSETLRRAQHILDKLSDLGVDIYKPGTRVDLGYAGGYYDGPSTNLMSAGSWFEAKGEYR